MPGLASSQFFEQRRRRLRILQLSRLVIGITGIFTLLLYQDRFNLFNEQYLHAYGVLVFSVLVEEIESISIGEKSGALEQLLSKIADFYDSEVKTTVASLTSMIEPIMIGVMGVLVGGIVLAIFMPIMKIQELIRK